jgi:hypothetical protein
MTARRVHPLAVVALLAATLLGLAVYRELNITYIDSVVTGPLCPPERMQATTCIEFYAQYPERRPIPTR